MLFSSLTQAQNVFIIGKLKTEDEAKIKSLATTLNLKYKINDMGFYYNTTSKKFYNFYNNDISNVDLLGNKLKEITSERLPISPPTSSAISEFKQNIEVLYPKKKKFHYVEINGNENIQKFNETINSKINELKALKAKGKYVAFLVVFKVNKPRIEITYPTSGDSIRNEKLIIKGTTSEPSGEVNVVVNGYTPYSAKILNPKSKSSDWEAKIELEDLKEGNTIEVIATNDGVQSETESITEIHFIKSPINSPVIVIPETILKGEPVPLPLEYIYPTDFLTAKKCVNNTAQSYKFTFYTYDNKINIDSLIIVFEDTDNKIIREKSIGKYKHEDIYNFRIYKQPTKDSPRGDYCLFVTLADLGFENPCDPKKHYEDEGTFYFYYFKYNKHYIPSPKVQINLPSFDEDNKDDNKECDCK